VLGGLGTDSAKIVVGRRGFFAGGAALALCGIPQCNSLVFDVSRNGSKIGTHRLDFSRSGDALTVRIDAEFRVGFGPITLFRYRHQGVERWDGGTFTSLDTATNENGRLFEVHAKRVTAGIEIRATDRPDQLAPAASLPLTHWALAAMKTPLFNPQTGKMLTETAQLRGTGTVALADGKPIAVTGYKLAGEAPIEDWYDSRGVWAALDATGSDGSSITYRRA
jgi:hypothetical protein